MLLPTTIVGSSPQPDCQVDSEKLAGRLPPSDVAQGKLCSTVQSAQLLRAQRAR